MTPDLVIALPFATLFAAGIMAGWWARNVGGAGAGDRHKGWASRGEVRSGMSKRAVQRSAAYTRPSLDNPRKAPVEECGVLLGFKPGTLGVPIYSALEDCVLIAGPPRQGKTIQLKGNVIQFPGAVVATSTKLDIIKETAKRRKFGHGPTYLFNPEGLGGVASTLRWSPVQGCGDPFTAIERAGYLLSGTAAGGGGAVDREFWNNNANKVLRAYLFAAAHGGYSMMDVKSWANNAKDHTAVELLLAMGNDAPAGWADELTQILGAYDRMRDSVFATLAQTFDFLGSPGAREVVDVGPAEAGFDVGRFLREKATLYLIGSNRDYGSIAPLFSALTGMIYETAKRTAEASRGGRLDPPVLFALDEAPNICPVPLHRWTSEAGSRGIPIITCIQSRKQLDDVWGQTRGAVIWENSTVKMFLPAGSDDETLERVSNLCGTYEVPRVTRSVGKDGATSTSTVMETRPVMAPHEIRMMEDFTALVLKGNKKPVRVKIVPFWERRAVRRAEVRATRRTAVPPPSPAPQPPHREPALVALPATATITRIHPEQSPKEAEESSG